jgi:hypothetical protein
MSKPTENKSSQAEVWAKDTYLYVLFKVAENDYRVFLPVRQAFEFQSTTYEEAADWLTKSGYIKLEAINE